jgi:2-polyprenyl-3-methyl-5-hydroxy-6-metoxy-1,4-benzoquinol methylase
MREDTPDEAIKHFSDRVKEFDAYYEERDEFVERHRLWTTLLDKYATPGGLALDMGCGTGVFTLHLAEKGGRVIGVDGAVDMIEHCEQRRRERQLANIRFVQATLPDVDETAMAGADLLISSSVVEYVPDLEAVLALFARLLKPGGVLVISLPNADSVSRLYERVKYRLTGQPAIYRYIRHFTSPKELADRVGRHGLALLEAHYYAHFTRAARLARSIGLSRRLTEDLFVAVFRKA